MIINLHIERLILNDLSVNPRESAQVHTALVADLTQRLQSEGLPGGLTSGGLTRGHAIAERRPPAIQIANNISSEHLGQKISQAVYRGIKP